MAKVSLVNFFDDIVRSSSVLSEGIEKGLFYINGVCLCRSRRLEANENFQIFLGLVDFLLISHVLINGTFFK